MGLFLEVMLYGVLLMKKIKVGLLRLNGCGGCFSKIYQNLNISKMLDIFEFVDLLKMADEKPDYVFIEGAINTGNHKLIDDFKKNGSKIVLFGSCSIDNFKFAGIDEHNPYHHFDIKVYGCPVDDRSIYDFLSLINQGRNVLDITYPVCKECAENNILCLLLDKIDCNGYKTIGNCSTLCPKIGSSCIGCRTKLGENDS